VRKRPKEATMQRIEHEYLHLQAQPVHDVNLKKSPLNRQQQGDVARPASDEVELSPLAQQLHTLREDPEPLADVKVFINLGRNTMAMDRENLYLDIDGSGVLQPMAWSRDGGGATIHTEAIQRKPYAEEIGGRHPVDLMV
jgi:hypothetical protein